MLLFINIFSDIINILAAPWGGKFACLTLTNTCPLDSLLSTLYMEYVLEANTQMLLENLAAKDHVARVLCDMFHLIIESPSGDSDASWAAARVRWMTQVNKWQIKV